MASSSITVANVCSVAQPCQTLCDPMNCSPPVTCVHGSFQTRILELVAISFPWQIEGEKKWKQWWIFFSWTPKSLWTVTEAMKLWSHERCLLLGRKAVTKLDSILKSRDISLTTKAQAIKTIIFPVVLYRCESWTIKKDEHQRTDVFKLQCWIRHLRVSWNVRKSNQSVLKEIFIIRTDAEDEALILWTLDAKSQPTGNDSDAEKDWWQEEKEMTEDEIVWWHHWHNGHDLDSDKEAWHVTRSWYDLTTEHNNNIVDPLPSFHLSPDPFTLW